MSEDLKLGKNVIRGKIGIGRGNRYAQGEHARATRWITALSLLLPVVYWLVESAVHTWVFSEGAYLDNLLTTDPNELWMRVLTALLLVAGGAVSAGTVRKLGRLERRNAALRDELEAALAKLLSGFVPICMYCKNIRDSNKRWDSVEKYLESRTEMAFSHGICPRCYAEHFPEEDAEGGKN